MTIPINLGGGFQTQTGIETLRKEAEERQEAAQGIEERGDRTTTLTAWFLVAFISDTDHKPRHPD